MAVAVAWATGGMGAELLGVTGSTTSLMANAAFTSLASQASITLINNKGDLGKTLKDLASSSTVKAALAAALTAGVLDKVAALPGMQALSQGTAFSDKLTYNLINATGRALTNTAINGGSLEDALKAAIVGGIVDTAHGAVSSQIKGLEADYIAHKLAHALAGCVAGAAAGGACRDGAIGAAVGEMVAQLFDDQIPAFTASKVEWDAYDAKILGYGKLVAGAVSAYAGGNAQTAITTAETAINNNQRTSARVRALQQQITLEQHYLNTVAQSYRNAITQSGGNVPGNATNSGTTVNYTRQDIAQYEAQLRTLDPLSPLLMNRPSSSVSPLPASYINFQYNVNMNNVVANGTTAFGFTRDSTGFFRELLRTNP